ncbi:hypothetical protein Gasu2_03080 [Galdieria sulphuraria]|uniref:Uncharacterized protein n=1 Tax=Galdieria sulphuraria TaxID=130081 RepID=M2Y0A6_GALSU|nr:uncharacterized protein Gasu_33290 [Galdieria sulphuraria]EME29323.1 hypothetical protein Gasu_33290 [Galdieria sulphuraria]GJD05859.1 hypothetical protein Gasu2_03080 [Galdieria sulphuraria]|eukprot:XP_005705843.1 hypothetical protein Gasu_33290 [Galdieria sulphuraria]
MSVLRLPLLLALLYSAIYFGVVSGINMSCPTEEICSALRNELDQLQDFDDCKSFYETGICSLLCLQSLEEIRQRNSSLWHICSSNCWSVAFVEFSTTLYDICREQHGFRRESVSNSLMSSLLYFCKRICLTVTIYFLMSFTWNTTYHWFRQKPLVSCSQRRDIESQNYISRGSRRHLFSLLRRQSSRNF